jgi:flavin reductase (DIM6/NTAB) family NADH-FMN oxidoreductase RutF
VPASPDSFRRVMSIYPTGVTVVTARKGDGSNSGCTCNAFCSISSEPALVLVSLDSTSTTLPAIDATRASRSISLPTIAKRWPTHFARKSDDKFTGLRTAIPEGGIGGPILIDDASAYLVCTVRELIACADHALVIGNVEAAVNLGGSSMVFHRRRYLSINQPAEGAACASARQTVKLRPAHRSEPVTSEASAISARG